MLILILIHVIPPHSAGHVGAAEAQERLQLQLHTGSDRRRHLRGHSRLGRQGRFWRHVHELGARHAGHLHERDGALGRHPRIQEAMVGESA